MATSENSGQGKPEGHQDGKSEILGSPVGGAGIPGDSERLRQDKEQSDGHSRGSSETAGSPRPELPESKGSSKETGQETGSSGKLGSGSRASTPGRVRRLPDDVDETGQATKRPRSEGSGSRAPSQTSMKSGGQGSNSGSGRGVQLTPRSAVKEKS